MKVQKGSIVWYYDKKLAEWKRGKVFCVNRWGVNVKSKHSVLFFSYMNPVIPASESKPDCDVETYRKRQWVVYSYKTHKNERLLRRLGFA